MSIRRKTCETMTLLYEAALKTNPEVEEPKDRPALINPTAGVSPRPAVGRVVWIKDQNRKGGGIWVAATEKDREDGGVPPDGCLLEHELEPGSEIARQWAVAKGKGVGQALPRIPTQMNGMEDGSALSDPLPGQTIDNGLSVPSFANVPNAANVNPQMNFGDMFPRGETTVMGSGSGIVTVSR